MIMTELVNIKSEGLPPIDQNIQVVFGWHSSDLFWIPNFEETEEVNQEGALEYDETETDAYVFGMVNQANGNIFFFTNLTRLVGELKKNGFTGIISYLTHEYMHLVRIIQSRAVLGSNFIISEWPTIGGDITESDTANLMEAISNAVTPIFMDILKEYLIES